MQLTGCTQRGSLSMAWSHSGAGSTDSMVCLASSPHGWLASAGPAGVMLFGQDSDKRPTATLGGDACTALSFSSDSATVAAIDGNLLRCWRVDSAAETASVLLPGDDPTGDAATTSLIPLDDKRFAGARGRWGLPPARIQGSQQHACFRSPSHVAVCAGCGWVPFVTQVLR